ncbi:uncharacterized protein LOC5518061 [Nematostella vectensis]|uniref:uncharacterized protein LOC5518061 n=1 Tax=Nematostella vectensis TaxID=45351 RepID=UPI00139002C7|nr:uncharacterized protein LOC5518061 [Nematostella vectensis]
MYLDKKNEVPPYRLTGPRSILKYIIILSTCLASACIVVAHRAFGNNYTWEYQTRYMLFLGTSLFGFLSSIIILVVFLTELDKVLCTRRVMEMINIGLSFVLALLCAVSSALLIYYVNKLWKNDLYNTSKDYWKWYTDHMLVAMACAFLNSILYILDMVLHAYVLLL